MFHSVRVLLLCVSVRCRSLPSQGGLSEVTLRCVAMTTTSAAGPRARLRSLRPERARATPDLAAATCLLRLVKLQRSFEVCLCCRSCSGVERGRLQARLKSVLTLTQLTFLPSVSLSHFHSHTLNNSSSLAITTSLKPINKPNRVAQHEQTRSFLASQPNTPSAACDSCTRFVSSQLNDLRASQY